MLSPKQGVGTDFRIGAGIVEGAAPVYASSRIESHFEVSTFTSHIRTVGFTLEAIAHMDAGLVYQAGVVVRQVSRRVVLQTEDDIRD